MRNLDNLVCILLHGPSAAGKTQTARGIAAPQGLITEEKYSNSLISWDYKPLSSALSEMHTVKVDIQGSDSLSRQLWMLHQVLADLFAPNSIEFDDFIKLLYDIAAYPLNITYDSDNRMVRDRDFMTRIADECHALKPNIFADNLVNKILYEYRLFDRENENTARKKVVIIPDLRLMPELESFEKLGCQLIKIRFDLSEQTQESRMNQRDGKQLTSEQLSHPTQSFKFDDSVFDLVINSDNLTLKDQISMVKDFIVNSIFAELTSNTGLQHAQH